MAATATRLVNNMRWGDCSVTAPGRGPRLLMANGALPRLLAFSRDSS